jgi:hypothetical protein
MSFWPPLFLEADIPQVTATGSRPTSSRISALAAGINIAALNPGNKPPNFRPPAAPSTDIVEEGTTKKVSNALGKVQEHEDTADAIGNGMDHVSNCLSLTICFLLVFISCA